MAYIIRYGPENPVSKNRKRLRFLLNAAFIILLLAGALGIRRSLLLHDPQTALALEALTQALQEGESIRSAMTEFCREIVQNALY